MFRQVPLSRLEGHELVPQAIIDRPTSHFTQRLNIPFTRGEDDFDTYEAAALELNGDIVFELKRYSGYPENSTTVYLPYDIDNVEQITRLIAIIADELHIPQTWISWQRRDNPYF